jgi:hypothetical protein
MRLTDGDAARFYAIWRPLLAWVNDALKIVPRLERNADGTIPAEDAAKIRDVLWKDEALLERFVAENPAALTSDLLAIAASWRHRRVGTFTVWKHYQRHTIFLDEDAYAVLGLYSTLDEILPMAPPIMVEATLLPFEGAIVHDGLIRSYNMFLGPGIRRSLLERYRDATARGAVHKTLGAPTSASEAVESRRPGSRRRLRRQPDLHRQRDGRT